jgi:hypothetical protein
MTDTGSAPSDSAGVNQELRTRLLRMKDRDQRVRARLLRQGALFERYAKEMEAGHLEHAVRLNEIVERHGWPRRGRGGMACRTARDQQPGAAAAEFRCPAELGAFRAAAQLVAGFRPRFRREADFMHGGTETACIDLLRVIRFMCFAWLEAGRMSVYFTH